MAQTLLLFCRQPRMLCRCFDITFQFARGLFVGHSSSDDSVVVVSSPVCARKAVIIVRSRCSHESQSDSKRF